MKRSEIYAFAVLVVALLVIAVLVLTGEQDFPPLSSLLIWIGLLAAAELLPISLEVGAEVTMDFPIHLALAIFYRSDPLIAMLIAGLGAIDRREFHGQLPLHKALFNRALSMLAVGASTIPFATYSSGNKPYELLPVASSAVLHLAVSLGLVAVAISLERGLPLRTALKMLIPPPVQGFVISYVLLTGLGVVTALAARRIDLWAVAAILVPLLFARLTIIGARAQQQLSERVRRQQEALLRATENLFQERERERQRIAGELHDSSLQSLAAATYASGNALDFLDAGHVEDARSALHSLHAALRATMAELRGALIDLRGPTLEEKGLMETIAQFADQVSTLWGVDVVIDSSMTKEPPIPVALAAFQIVQESVINALKHSGSKSISVRITNDDGMVHVLVEDDGAGFDPHWRPGKDHLGIELMKQRATKIGGWIELDSQPGRGTRVEAMLPSGAAQ